MSKRPATFTADDSAALETIPTQSSARRLDAAIEHLKIMWRDAEGPQVGGRRFYGKIIMEVPFEDGQPQDILASKMARDRVGCRL